MKYKDVASYKYFNYNEKKALEGIIKEIENTYPLIKKIILYGSKARGDFLEESDIDILMVCKKEVRIGKIMGRLMKLREEADYYPEMFFTEEDSLEAIKEADAFLRNVEKFFKK